MTTNIAKEYLAFSQDDVNSIDASIFDDNLDRNHLVVAIKQVQHVVNQIIHLAPVGNHILSLSMNETSDRLAFFKDSSAEAMIAPNVLHFASYASLALLRDKASLMDLYSFISDSTDSMATLLTATPEALHTRRQEMRAWALESSTLRALNATEVMNLHCFNAFSGVLSDPDKNMLYSSGWDIPVEIDKTNSGC